MKVYFSTKRKHPCVTPDAWVSPRVLRMIGIFSKKKKMIGIDICNDVNEPNYL